MAFFIVYDAQAGSESDRPVLRWGEVPQSSDVALQAEESNEAAAEVATLPFEATEGTTYDWFYDESTGDLSFVGLADPVFDGSGLSADRSLRNELLAETDYTQLPDVPISAALRGDFETYRQALRDLPAQSGWPDSITYPVKPTYQKN